MVFKGKTVRLFYYLANVIIQSGTGDSGRYNQATALTNLSINQQFNWYIGFEGYENYAP